MVLEKKINGRGYVCPRPEWKVSNFFYNSIKDGCELTSKVLFENERSLSMLDEKKRLWISDFPTPQILRRKVLNDVDWFFKKIKEREKVFNQVKNPFTKLSKKLKETQIAELIKELEGWRTYNTLMFPYMWLVGLIDEMLSNEFKNFLIDTDIPVELTNKYLFSILRSNYAKSVLNKGIILTNKKEFTFPSGESFFIESKIDYNLFSDLDCRILKLVLQTNIHQRWTLAERFLRYRLVVPIVSQTHEEDYYTWKSYQVYTNKILEVVAQYLKEKRKLRYVGDIVNYSIEEISDLVKRA